MTKFFFIVLILVILISVVLTFMSLFLPRKNTTSLKIFNNKPQPIKKLQTSTLILSGDVMLGRTVMTKSLDEKDIYYPFKKIASELVNADLTFVNLENPIVANCPRHTDGFKFCTTPEIAKGLGYAGVDVVNLANNHSRNYGEIGLDDTVNYLATAGILVTGVDNLVVKDIGVTKFGFLGFNFTFGDPAGVIELILESDKKVDILVIAVHWGEEYKTTANSHQQAWAGKMIEAGADVIAGSHPHWVQNIECFQKGKGVATNPPEGWNSFAPRGNSCLSGTKPVYYSLGNLVFDQMWSENTRKGMVVKLTFEDGELIGEERMETYMRNWAQPETVSARDIERWTQH